MEFQTSVVTNKAPEEAVKAVEAALAERKFGVLWHLHMNEKLAEKGVTMEPDVHVLEVCNPVKAKHVLETNSDLAYFLPCKVVVKKVGGETRIGIARPTVLMGMAGDERLTAMAEEVEKIMVEAVQAAAQ